MRRDWVRSITSLWLASSLAVTSCRTPAAVVAPPKLAGTATPTVPAVSGARPSVPLDLQAGEDGALSLRLTGGRPASAITPPTALSTAETQALLARLPPLPTHPAPAPAVRAPSLAPPRTGSPPRPIAFATAGGTVIADAAVSKPTPVPLPLVAPAITPSGEIRSEAEITVRFDEPMVPVAAVGPVANVSATITPPIAGTWRWLDTRVATFTAKRARFPAATEITVTVPPGIRAVSGSTLATAATSTFSTPPVTLTGRYPRSPLRTDSPIAVKLDQAIDPAAIAGFLRVEAKGKRIAVEPIALAEARTRWARHPAHSFDAKELGDHYVILAPKTAWPAGIEARVVLGKGAPSSEGPRVTRDETEVSFDVIAPFTVRGLTCDDVETPRMTGLACAAKGYLYVELSNALDRKSYRSAKIQIDGTPLEDHAASGNSIVLTVPATVGKPFTITIADDLVDTHGQSLVGPRRLSFTTKPERVDSMIDAPGGLYILDPRFEIPQWVIEAEAVTALRVELFQVEPADYFAFLAFEAGKRAVPPGKRVHVMQHPIGARFGATARVDLRPALGPAGTGHVIAVASATPAKAAARIAAWIQVTRLGVTTRIDGEQASAWVQQLSQGSFLAPQAGVATSLVLDGAIAPPAAVTDAHGHAMLELPPAGKPNARKRDALLVARAGSDSVFAAIGGDHQKSIREHDARWYVTDDRFTYKPGETVYVKGWVRWSHSGVNPGLAMPATDDSLSYTLVDKRDNKLASGTAKLTPQGGFDLEVALPANANLGVASFTFQTRHETHTHPIAIEEFRTPSYAVTLDDDVTHSGATPVFAGESIEMSASAKYYSGGGLAGARVRWRASLSAASYRPPGWDAFTFASVRPRSERFYRHRDRDRGNGVTVREQSSLDGASASNLVLGITAVPNREPSVLTVEASVTDLDRQTIRASSRAIVVHPSAYYVGLRQRPKTTDTLELVVTDVDGAAVPGVPIEVTVEGTAGADNYDDEAKVVDTQRCKVTSAAHPVTCSWKPRDDRTAYIAVARVADARGRANAAQLFVPWWPSDDSKPDLAIIPDRATYRPGDVAKLDLRSTVVPATAVVSFARQGIIAQRRLELTAPSTIVELPIEVAHIQNVHVVVDRWAKRPGSDPKFGALPEHVTAERELRVDLEGARLAMTARPLRPLVQPGEAATFEVEVRHGDQPVAGAEVALLAVDEAVLALSAKRHADPLAPFYFDVAEGTSVVTTLDLIRDQRADLAHEPGFTRVSLDERGRGGRGGMRGRHAAVPSVSIGQPNAAGKQIIARKDFRATAVWSPRLTTDASGRATVTVKMPDSLTRFRIVALATANTRYFGKAESTIATQRKLNARTVAPRFLTQGDRFELPVVVQNLDTSARTIEVAVRAANLTASGPSGKRVTVPAGGRAEVRFGFATSARGRAVIQTVVTSNDAADATTIELPVYEPATTESFATYGIVDEAPQFEQLAVPADIFPDVGGIETELASTQLQSLTDAFWYLQTYPFECAEQRSSRMLATSAMADLLDAFATAGRPTRDELQAIHTRDLAKLEADQRPDGGWGYFRDMEADPYVSIQVLAALAAHPGRGPMTKRAGQYVTALATTSLARLEAIAKTPTAERKAKDRAELPYLVSLTASALTAIAAMGIDVRPRAERLHAAATALTVYPIDARARLLALVARQDRNKAMRATLLGELLSASRETAASATIAASYVESERLLLVSNHKTTALVLEALIREAPAHALIPKLARGLLDARRRGRWISTQENLAVLQAMRRYFDTYEKATPSFTGKLWFGSAAYAEQRFDGRSSTPHASQLGWASLAPSSTHDVTLHKAGTGRMYYRIGITYAPKRLDLPPLDAGFIVRRSYEAVDHPADVTRTATGWKIKLGARVLVTLEALTTAPRHGVALVDPMPAGFEPVNTRLAISERATAGSTDAAWDHTNLRDNRSEAFAMELSPGSHRYSYTARATTPGTFVAAPAKAEEMYSPETFGRSAGTTVVIE